MLDIVTELTLDCILLLACAGNYEEAANEHISSGLPDNLLFGYMRENGASDDIAPLANLIENTRRDMCVSYIFKVSSIVEGSVVKNKNHGFIYLYRTSAVQRCGVVVDKRKDRVSLMYYNQYCDDLLFVDYTFAKFLSLI